MHMHVQNRKNTAERLELSKYNPFLRRWVSLMIFNRHARSIVSLYLSPASPTSFPCVPHIFKFFAQG